jgi:hypothetical protein
LGTWFSPKLWRRHSPEKKKKKKKLGLGSSPQFLVFLFLIAAQPVWAMLTRAVPCESSKRAIHIQSSSLKHFLKHLSFTTAS